MLLPVNNSVLNVEGHDGLPIEGSTVRFTCPPGLELVGSNSAICNVNGEWEPDPSGLMCNDSKGLPVIPSLPIHVQCHLFVV